MEVKFWSLVENANANNRLYCLDDDRIDQSSGLCMKTFINQYPVDHRRTINLHHGATNLFIRQKCGNKSCHPIAMPPAAVYM